MLGGHLVWLVMFIIALLGLWSTYEVSDGSGSRISATKEQEDISQ